MGKSKSDKGNSKIDLSDMDELFDDIQNSLGEFNGKSKDVLNRSSNFRRKTLKEQTLLEAVSGNEKNKPVKSGEDEMDEHILREDIAEMSVAKEALKLGIKNPALLILKWQKAGTDLQSSIYACEKYNCPTETVWSETSTAACIDIHEVGNKLFLLILTDENGDTWYTLSNDKPCANYINYELKKRTTGTVRGKI